MRFRFLKSLRPLRLTRLRDRSRVASSVPRTSGVVRRDESDAAISGMRERYVAVAVQIADTLTVLARAAANAPSKARTATLTAISQIAAAQEKLSDETRRLPASPVERFALMQTVLQAQQGALVQLALIVKQLSGPPIGRFTGGGKADQLSRYQLPTAQVARPKLGRRAPVVSRRAPADDSEGFPDRWAMSRIERRRQSRAHARARDREERRAARAYRSSSRRISVFFKAAVSRSLLVVIVVASGLLIAYGTFPQAGDRPEATRRIDLPTRTLPAATPAPVPRTEPPAASQRTTRGYLPSANTRVAMRDPVIADTPSEPPTSLPPPAAPQYVVRNAPSGVSFAPPIPVTRGPPNAVAPETRNTPVGPVAAKPEPVPERTVIAAVTPPTKPADLGFVPVLFTHREESIVNRAFFELQHRFPAQLQRRKVEVQAVDMGEKGVWHRLLLLPPRPRDQADTVCQALMTGGYDRCWVKAY
jgi:hypothetical protein